MNKTIRLEKDDIKTSRLGVDNFMISVKDENFFIIFSNEAMFELINDVNEITNFENGPATGNETS